MNNKTGVSISSPLTLIIAILGFLIVVYLVLYLPIPKFTEIRSIINYFSIIIFFFAIQGLLIYGYWKLGSIAYKSFSTFQQKAMNFTHKLSDMISN
jgi:hypothetical protein